jgi:hypothetical protein
MTTKKSSSASTGVSNSTLHSPEYVMKEVKLLLADISTPESAVEFDSTPKLSPTNSVASQRATPQTIQDRINPLTTWTWANLAERDVQQVTVQDLGKIGYETDANKYWQLTRVSPVAWLQAPNPANTSSPFELSTGAADADSYHDFYRLQIAFEDVWTELIDNRLKPSGQQLYATFDALMDVSPDAYDDTGKRDRGKRFANGPTDVTTGLSITDIAGADELQTFIDNLKIVLGISDDNAASSQLPADIGADITLLQNAVINTLWGCDMLLFGLNHVGNFTDNGWLAGLNNDVPGPLVDGTPVTNPTSAMTRQEVFNKIIVSLQSLSPSQPPAPSTPTFPDLANLLNKVNAILKERYRFDIFAPASINYGVLLNYRQHWQPQSYQVGNLVSTIPLAPQETRKYTTKFVVKKTRNVKEISNALRSRKDDSSSTSRTDAEIVDRAKNQSSFQTNANGSYGNDAMFKVSAGLQKGADQAVESAQTKRDFHEAVVKSAQEYRNEHRMEISTEETTEDETTSYREIRNPNDELTVTYLFYELQRRYVVDESLYKAKPVILVANDVPAPHDVDESWLLRYDWIIKRAILDDSFLPALAYLSSNYTGENLTLQVLELSVQQQKIVVDNIAQQVQLAQGSLNNATIGLQASEDQSVSDQQRDEVGKFVKSFFDPLGIAQGGATTDGESERARVDFAKDTMNRAQAKVNQLVSDLKSETTALQVAIDKYTAAATKHFGMLAEIDRLRIHVKDNIIYYMQAIWSYEPTDQRFFRIYNLDVPIFAHNTTLKATAPKSGLELIDTEFPALDLKFPTPTLSPGGTMKLHEVADIENLLGFKGNYMIFPMTEFNYMTWYLMHDYLHFEDLTGVTVQDPDPYANLTTEQLKTAIDAIQTNDPGAFEKNQSFFQEAMLRLLSQQAPEMVIVPSKSLYIEALPGTHPLLEDFKLIHRAIDIKKAQAEARHTELENLRLAARLANGELGDPDIDKVVVVGSGKNVTVDAGQ